jgi:FkbM family methyltransferase
MEIPAYYASWAICCLPQAGVGKNRAHLFFRGERHMLDDIKTYIRSSPRVFDVLKNANRLISRKPDPAYEFFKKYSRMRSGRIKFLQIGAADGMRNDPLREFIVGGWCGILVEPIPQAFALLTTNYSYLADRLKFVNAAITRADGAMTLYGFEKGFLDRLPLEKRLDYLRKVSFDRAHVEHYVLPDERASITATEVPCMTIATLLAKYWNTETIHLLAIDAEGHEPEIIRSNDFSTFQPETIFYESHTLRESVNRELEEFLAARGYESFRILGDTVAMSSRAMAEYRKIVP